MNHSSDSQEQPLRKQIRHQGRLSGSLLSLTLVRLRGDGGAIFHSPHGVTYEQLGKGNNEFIDLEEAISLYPTPAQIPEFLLPSRDVLDTVKNSQGEVVRCPFCPSTFSGIVAKKSFKRHLQRHWNHAVTGKVDQIDQPKVNLPASLISPIVHPVLDMKKPSNIQDYPGVQQSSHALLTSTPPLITPTDYARTSAPLTPPERPLVLTTSVHAASNTTKLPARKNGRKSVSTSIPGTVRKDTTTLAIARTMEALRSKTGIVFHRPDAHPNLEHQSFTRREGQLLDVDATFSMFPTIDDLPEGFWPTSHQYFDAAPGQHRIRCLFCTWSFTGVHVKANFRGHLRYHWKLAAASQKPNPSPVNSRVLSAEGTPSYGPSASSLGPAKLIKNSHLLQPDVPGSSKLTAAQPSLLCEIGSSRIDQFTTPGSLVTNPDAWRPQARKRNYTEAFLVEDMSGSESAPSKRVDEYANSPSYSVELSIAQALSTIRRKSDAIFIPPEQSISYEELIKVMDRYFDIDRVVAVYPFLEQLPVRFWPSDETFEEAGTKEGPGSVRCPFCIMLFKGTSAKNSLKMHMQCHWWHTSERSGSKTCAGILTGSIESADGICMPHSLGHTATPLPSSTALADMNLEKAQLSIIRPYKDLEVNHGGDGTPLHGKGSRLRSTHPLTRAQNMPRYVLPSLLQSLVNLYQVLSILKPVPPLQRTSPTEEYSALYEHMYTVCQNQKRSTVASSPFLRMSAGLISWTTNGMAR